MVEVEELWGTLLEEVEEVVMHHMSVVAVALVQLHTAK